MKSHRLIFVTCAILFCVLFFDGLLIVSKLNKTDKRKLEQNNGNYNHTEINKLSNQNKGNGSNNRRIDFQQDESSIWEEAPVNLLVLGLDGDETRADVIRSESTRLNSSH